MSLPIAGSRGLLGDRFEFLRLGDDDAHDGEGVAAVHAQAKSPENFSGTLSLVESTKGKAKIFRKSSTSNWPRQLPPVFASNYLGSDNPERPAVRECTPRIKIQISK